MLELDPSGVRWRKSGRSADTNTCVEVAIAGPAAALRDSKNPTGPALTLPVGSLAGLVDFIR